MLKIGAGKRFLEELRKLDERLRKIKINTVVVDRETKDLKFNFICDKAVDKPLEEKCSECGAYMVESKFRYGGKTYKKCSNPECVTNQKKKTDGKKES